MDARTALIFCGGGDVVGALPRVDLVVAADSGAAEAHRRGLRVDLLVGDMDSISPADLTRVEGDGGEIERHPADKDATDLELALAATVARGVPRATVAGGDGGRFDHLLANALVLASPRFAAIELDGAFGAARVHVVRGHRNLDGTPGEAISLLAVGGPARGVRTTGLRWALDGDELDPGSSRGISNEFVETTATVTVDHGVLVAIRPGVER